MISGMSDTVELLPVRRRDLRQPAYAGSAAELPGRHGGKADPRYPSSTSLRQFLSFVIDLVMHLAVPAAVGYALYMRVPGVTSAHFIVIAAAGFVALSILDRIFVQWATQATIGKALTALRMIRDDTGRRPTLWQLTKAWFFGLVVVFSLLS
jgi:hypothetical protein